MVREGTFKYITHNNYYCGEETLFAPDEVRDNCYEDYLRKTVSYFVEKDEPTLLFFPTRKDTRSTSKYVSHNGDYRNGYLTSMSMVDVENMGGRAGKLNQKEKNFTNFLLKAIAKGINTGEKLDNHFKELTSDFKKDAEKLSPTRAGILINSRGIDIDTYLLFKEYLENKKGKLTNLELITLLTKSSEGKNIPIPFPQFNQSADCYYKEDWKYYYQDKMSELVSDQGEDGKEIYQDILELNGEDCHLDLDTDDYLSIKKALLLYDWIGSKEIKEIEEEYRIYGGGIRKLGEGFSWLADSLAAVAEDLSWSKKKNQKEILC